MRVVSGAVLALTVALSNASCSLAGGPNAGVWGLNDSSNDYVVRIWTSDVPSSWAFPAESAGFIASGRNLQVQILDRATCALVVTSEVSANVLISVDQHGRVEFLVQPEAPAMDVELNTSDECAPATPPPSGQTAS